MLHTEAFSNEDSMYMHRCLQLAACGAGSTSPNPMVGAVIVCDGRIIGEGYHIRAGEPHAEVNAVNSVRESDRHLLKSSTIYVSLEPCSHYGKTPPCCDLIISCGIPRVVIATTDSNLQVNGRGISRMEAAGIDVRVGLLGAESRRLNRAFFTRKPTTGSIISDMIIAQIAGKKYRTNLGNTRNINAAAMII